MAYQAGPCCTPCQGPQSCGKQQAAHADTLSRHTAADRQQPPLDAVSLACTSVLLQKPLQACTHKVGPSNTLLLQPAAVPWPAWAHTWQSVPKSHATKFEPASTVRLPLRPSSHTPSLACRNKAQRCLPAMQLCWHGSVTLPAWHALFGSG
jgi:hypothetical protein